MDNEPIKCRCEDCGKTFNRGDEGDNERFCLRCERVAFRDIDLEGDHAFEPWSDEGDDGP